jgi:hypothetical protein
VDSVREQLPEDGKFHKYSLHEALHSCQAAADTGYRLQISLKGRPCFLTNLSLRRLKEGDEISLIRTTSIKHELSMPKKEESTPPKTEDVPAVPSASLDIAKRRESVRSSVTPPPQTLEVASMEIDAPSPVPSSSKLTLDDLPDTSQTLQGEPPSSQVIPEVEPVESLPEPAPPASILQPETVQPSTTPAVAPKKTEVIDLSDSPDSPMADDSDSDVELIIRSPASAATSTGQVKRESLGPSTVAPLSEPPPTPVEEQPNTSQPAVQEQEQESSDATSWSSQFVSLST